MFDTVLFDLDGTLTQSGIGITRSVAHSLKKFGIVETDQTKLDRFVGPPLIDSYMRYYGFCREQAVQAVAYYREYYASTGIFENRVYDGVESMLQALQKAGKTCILATSKPEHYAVQILEHFGLSDYFAFVAGATMDETRTGKADVIAYALKKAGHPDTPSWWATGSTTFWGPEPMACLPSACSMATAAGKSWSKPARPGSRKQRRIL